MDKITKEQRSKNMSAIRGKGNKTTEKEFIRYLKANKIIGWRRHQKGAYGAPDFLFKKRKMVVFIDGCFWHGCKKHCKMPKTNRRYWLNKINNNIKRDRVVNSYYRKNFWAIIRIWEHSMKNNLKMNKVYAKKILGQNI